MTKVYARRLPASCAPRAVVLLLCAALQYGCNKEGPGARQLESGAIVRDTAVVHEECPLDSGGAERLDANGDGKPDVIIVREGGREVCRAFDLNFDGVMDSFVYYDASGQVRRRENDYDRDGRIDEITLFRAGVVTEKQRATLVTGKLDTWEFYEAGKLARAERDSNGDQVIDQWWEYPQPGCPLIHADVNNDGRPDLGASVDYCKETGYVPPERQEFRKPESPNFQQPSGLPTEVESKDAPAPSGTAAPKSGDGAPKGATP